MSKEEISTNDLRNNKDKRRNNRRRIRNIEDYSDVTGNFLDTFSHFNFPVSEEAYYDNPWFDCLSEDEAVAAWENTH